MRVVLAAIYILGYFDNNSLNCSTGCSEVGLHVDVYVNGSRPNPFWRCVRRFAVAQAGDPPTVLALRLIHQARPNETRRAASAARSESA